MDAIECIMNRRTCRAYKPDMPEKDKLDAVLEAARMAPSGMSRYTKHFTVVTDADWLARMNARVRTLAGEALRVHLLREDEGFAVTERILLDITPEIDAVYLCNPNNPTGRTIEPRLLHRVVEKCAQNDIWLVVDECFNDFLTDGARHSLKLLLGDYPKLVILRAYTKMYAVPGVRFGWCMTSNTDLIEGLYRAGQPWNVSVIAQACAAAAAGEAEYAAQTAARIAQERIYLTEELTRRGLTVYPGEANFLLFRSQDDVLQGKLAARGVLIRNCANYRGLGAGYYRTAVKTREDTARLLAALDSIQEGY